MHEAGFEPAKTLSHRVLNPAHLTALELVRKKLLKILLLSLSPYYIYETVIYFRIGDRRSSR